MRNAALLLAAAIAVLCEPSGAHGDCREAARSEALEAAWSALLEKAVERSADAREYVERTSKEASQTVVRRLALRLLEEWDLPRDEVRLTRPSLVWRPEIDFDSLPAEALHVTTPRVVVEGEVTPEGELLNPAVIRSSGNQQLDDTSLAIASKARYRPAWSEDIFVSARAVIVFHLEPR